MKCNTVLKTSRLILRPWTLSRDDRETFYVLQSDEKVRRFYPNRNSRSESDELLETLISRYSTRPMHWCAACLKQTNEPVGMTGLALFEFDVPFAPGTEIGWIYRPEYWRKGFASEAAAALLDHGFNTLKLDEIVAFTAKTNLPSQGVMKKLGLQRDHNRDFDHPLIIAEDQFHLRPHCLYAMTRAQWQKYTQI